MIDKIIFTEIKICFSRSIKCFKINSGEIMFNIKILYEKKLEKLDNLYDLNYQISINMVRH